eukprot:TRINITY_DN2612_c0_g2_i1.p1 TRINITY_DN2612_c0_g2~~TRINITY_DN2612_c0_g2_i1.p1  ORF type:complete len:770 (-),score=108.87 TRINITY_DN2612_c0_g2_i1:110-2140(-)
MRTADAGFKSCSADHNNFDVSLRTLSNIHKTCRGNESQLKGAMDRGCGDDRDVKTKRYIAECDVFALQRAIPGELPSTCSKVHGGTNQHESGRLAEYFKNLRDSFVGWQDKCEAARSASDLQNRTCADKTVEYANKSAECDQAQIALDSAACWQYRQGDCQAFSRCWAQARQNFVALNSSIATAVTARKQESVGLQKIMCYLDVLNASQVAMSGQAVINSGIQACDGRSYDTSGFDIISLYYANRAPLLPTMPACSASEVWPRPGTAAYVAQEYDSLPDDAPARECQSVCCLWCSYYECPGPRFPNASCIKAHTAAECCDSVVWRAEAWTNVTCNSSCGQAAFNVTRSVLCQDKDLTIYPDSECANSTKPATTKPGCPATSACATCAAGACNKTGTYLQNCGGFNSGSCKECNITSGNYATGIGGVNEDTSCPSSPCSLRAVCPAGQYLDGCGGSSAGICKPCTNTCLHGSYSDGCTGLSSGSCLPCNVPSGYLAITAGSSSSDRCDTVAGTQASATSGTCNSLSLASFTLDKDANAHRAIVSGQTLQWVRLTELCQRSDVTPGWMRYKMSVAAGKNYKVAVEAAWLPESGPGLKGSKLCSEGGSSVLQLQVTGSGNEDPVGAKVSACFDQVKFFGWSTVWFEFAPSAAQVELTFKESKYSCLSIKSVSICEVDAN